MKRVVLLMGGRSVEREVSLVSGRDCAAGLAQAGYQVTTVDVHDDLGVVLKALEPKPDLVFNALHGRYGEDGIIQGVLDWLGIPYTHSGVLASALAMDKTLAKRLFESAGIRCPAGQLVPRGAVQTGDVMARPYVVKPNNEGSSVGVHIVREGDNALPFTGIDWPFGEQVVVEPYIPGRELTVGVMGGRPLAVTELRPRQGFYDYAAKYTAGRTEHLIPAPVHPAIYQEALDMALAAHRILGCRGVSRADFRYDDTKGEPGPLYV
ncbi:MAG: D-alanine--D-alanine ligase, partial [Pseudomonadota bacterium]